VGGKKKTKNKEKAEGGPAGKFSRKGQKVQATPDAGTPGRKGKLKRKVVSIPVGRRSNLKGCFQEKVTCGKNNQNKIGKLEREIKRTNQYRDEKSGACRRKKVLQFQ